MSRTTLATYLFGYNLDAILYPWREAVASALELSDGVYLCCCDDDTLEKALDLAEHEPKFHVLEHAWADEYYPPEEQHKYKIQAIIGNYILGYIATHYDYALKLDADEVLHEGSFEEFRREMEWMKRNDVVLARPHYTHFIDEHTEFDFIYRTRAVISQCRAGLRFSLGRGGDACALGGAPEFQTSLEIAHYGKYAVGREREAILKEFSFQQNYTALGFPDPLVVKQFEGQGYADYHKIFHVAKGLGQFRQYSGSHPKFIQKWIEDSKLRSEEFWSKLKLSQSNAAVNTT